METMYFGGYAAEFPGGQPVSGYVSMPPMNPQSPSFPTNPVSGQGQLVSGIDPRYLATFADSNASYIAGQRPSVQRSCERQIVNNGMPFVGDYQNRTFAGAERHKPKTFTQQQVMSSTPNSMAKARDPQKSVYDNVQVLTDGQKMSDVVQKPRISCPAQLSAVDVDLPKREYQNPVKTRLDKIKVIQKNGPRAFSGPVEKVLKWHKALQDVGILILYEIVAKCVSVRPGESCAKNLVIRDDNGPAIQVVYYEIDFLLPELKPPCTVRVIGRIMPGTCRLQAFSVRTATGDDVAILPRRAAVASHHVSKICKEFDIAV
ncbi:uncharacterized protein LOC113235913 [Hyposmocoma kahamanoa]|uniref:uncharacterized protein LOC113235913 n=1 Tax=Hyposmocoma kahamanoa TaxID=1477025 RepID=UPI000E6DA4B2|nr:uncharacterized protein LOC113235913 [Hyposmocoma kahamanoa]